MHKKTTEPQISCRRAGLPQTVRAAVSIQKLDLLKVSCGSRPPRFGLVLEIAIEVVRI
jgi:hypothetical protein